MEHNLKINDLILLTIKRLGINGEGIGYYKRLAVFVDGAIPGEIVEVKIIKLEKRYVYGEITKFKQRSADRVNPKAPKLIGAGYNLQHIKYEKQLILKKESIKEALERYYKGNLDRLKISNTLTLNRDWEYSNFLKLPVRHDGEKLVVGFHDLNTNQLIHLNEYLLENKVIKKALTDILNFLTLAEINIYNPKFDQGNLRYIAIRGLEETKEVQVTFILMEEEPRILNIFKQLLELDNIKSINYTINPDAKSSEFKEVKHLAGSKHLEINVSNLKYHIFPNSLLEENLKLNLMFYEAVLKELKINNKNNILDLYCGSGIFSLMLARGAKEVRALDDNSLNIKNIRVSQSLNNLNNLKLYSGNILDKVYDFSKEGYKSDVIVISPSRAGLDSKMVYYLKKSKAKKIVYFSKNHSTLGKDLNQLKNEFIPKLIIPVDLNPNTPYIDCCVILETKR